MPIFEFTCTACGAGGEDLFTRASDVEKHPCPKCNGAVTKRISKVVILDREVLCSDICKPMTELEKKGALIQKKNLESKWREIKNGDYTLHQGKYRDKSLDPDLKHMENMG